MPLIKLSRINKGGEIVINSEQILFVEIESKATTVHMSRQPAFLRRRLARRYSGEDGSGTYRTDCGCHPAEREWGEGTITQD